MYLHEIWLKKITFPWFRPPLHITLHSLNVIFVCWFFFRFFFRGFSLVRGVWLLGSLWFLMAAAISAALLLSMVCVLDVAFWWRQSIRGNSLIISMAMGSQLFLDIMQPWEHKTILLWLTLLHQDQDSSVLFINLEFIGRDFFFSPCLNSICSFGFLCTTCLPFITITSGK